MLTTLRRIDVDYIGVLAFCSALFGTLSRLVVSLPEGAGVLLYFTVQSNIMVCVFLLWDLLLRKKKDRSREALRGVVHGGIVLSIIVTGLVYNILLAPGHEVAGFEAVIVFFNHSVTPILFVVDWFFRQRRYRYTVRSLLPWLVYPIAYLVFGSLEGALTGSFRYFFLDFLNQESGRYALGMVMVTALFLLLGWTLVSLNRRWGGGLMPKSPDSPNDLERS